VDNNLRPTVTYLVDDVGLGMDGAVKLITKYPQTLGMSVVSNIAPKVRYLEEEVGLGRAGAVKVLARCPSVLGCSVEDNIAPTVRFLAEEAGAGREGAATLILQRPNLLGYSIKHKLRPTLRFLSEHFPDTNAAKLVSLANYSLAGRLVPRVRLLRKHGQAGRFAARSMATFISATFCEKVGITMEEYDDEVVACVRENAEKHLGLETGGGVRRRGG
jgi:mTERF domain-containing protein